MFSLPWATPPCTAGCQLTSWEAVHIFYNLKNREEKQKQLVAALKYFCKKTILGGVWLTCWYCAVSRLVVKSIRMFPALVTEIQRAWRRKRNNLKPSTPVFIRQSVVGKTLTCYVLEEFSLLFKITRENCWEKVIYKWMCFMESWMNIVAETVVKASRFLFPN